MTIATRMRGRAAALLAALTLAAAPAVAQPAGPSVPPMNQPARADRNFDPNILLYAAFPVLIALILAIAASSTSDGDQPASA